MSARPLKRFKKAAVSVRLLRSCCLLCKLQNPPPKMLFSGVQHFLLALASSVALNALVVEGTLGSRKVDTVYAPRITYPTAGTTWTSGGPGSCVWFVLGV